MRRVVDEVMPWGNRSIAHVRIWQPASGSGRPAVILGALEDNHARSITNDVEEVVEAVIDRFLGTTGIDADWFDYWPPAAPDRTGEFDVITFLPGANDRRGRRGRGRGQVAEPKWHDIDHRQLEAFIGDSVECYEFGTYTAENVRRFASSGPTAVSMEWDDQHLREDIAAVRILAEALADETCDPTLLPVADTILQLLAMPSRSKFAALTAATAAQPASAPIKKVAPEISQATWSVLDRWASHGGPIRETPVRQAVQALRQWLLHNHSPAAGRLRRSALGLSWRGVNETAVIDLEHDSIEVDSMVSALRYAEHACSQWLYENDDAFIDEDRPTTVPSEPIEAKGPIAKRYLDTVSWWGPRAEHQPWARQLDHELDDVGGGGGRVGYDPWGRLVLESASKSHFVVEWPIQAPDHLDRGTTLRAGTGTGARPVFLELEDGRLDILPADPMSEYAPEFAWGYGGGGPHTLARAIWRLLVAHSLVVDDPNNSDSWDRLNDLACGRGPIGMSLDEIVAVIQGRRDAS